MTAPQTLTLDAALQQAVAHHQAGRLPEAEQLYRAILQVAPDQPDANHNLGVLAGQVGQHAAGLPYLKIALEANQVQGQHVLSYAEALLATDQAREALDILQAAMLRGFNTVAAKTLRQKIEAALQNGAATGETPTPVEISRLIALFNAGHHVEMESHARLLLKQHPNFGFAWKALGASLLAQGKDALASLLKAAELLPDDAEVHNNLGCALKECGQFDAAVAGYTKALAIKPDFVEAHNNLGNAMQDYGRLNAAVASYTQALEIKPDYAEAHSNLGSALQDLGRLEEAVASYLRALEIKPDYARAHSNFLLTLNYDNLHPHSFYIEEACRFGRMVDENIRTRFSAWPCSAIQHERLRVGLVSADLRNHPVGYFLESLTAHIDPTRLEITAYPTNRFEDELTARIKPCFAAWKSLIGLSDEAAAGLIHADGIDILIDLSGHTAYNRLPLFAWKPAPVQASWLGYFATTGMTAMDYFLADPWTAPEAEEHHFTEKIQRLPETYLCFTPPHEDAPLAPLPALTNGYITFGCFNNLVKMNDAVVTLWARVLQAVPGSRLFLKTKQLGETAVRQSTLKRFAARGIDANRLILEGAAPRAELLAAYRRVDIALDPFPYPGGATSAEALWMGAPVLTLAGERFLSHIGESILQNAGLPEWIGDNADDYVAKAAKYAGDPHRLAVLRDGLRQQVSSSPLFDAPRFAHHFETALRDMWGKWCASRA